MLKEAPFRPRPSTQSEETAGVCLPVSQPCRSTLSSFRSFSSLPHLTHKDRLRLGLALSSRKRKVEAECTSCLCLEGPFFIRGLGNRLLRQRLS